MSEKTTMQLVESVIVETVLTKTKLDLAEQAIQRVRELHTPFDKSTIGTSTGWCPQCGDYGQILYPCDTIKALDGEQ